MKVLLTTVPGLEFIVQEELGEIIGKTQVTYSPLTGRVFAEVEEEKLPSILSLHSVEAARIILSQAPELEEAVQASLSHLEQLTRGVGVQTFAVLAERISKDAPFTSLDLAREIGKLLAEKLNLRVQLDAPDLVVYAEYNSGQYSLGVDLAPFASLRDRPYRAWLHRSALNPIIAYAMCRLAMPFTKVLDPFCGGGTIILECQGLAAAQEAICSDVNLKAVEGAHLNAQLVRAAPHLLVQDVRFSALRRKPGLDAVIANPPFGIRERAVGGIKRVYKALFNAAYESLEPGGKLVVLSPLKKTVIENAELFHLNRLVEISEGGLRSWVFVFTRG
ncbi:MAG: THUMP domain-containing protein [Infirmifilum sp.]